MAKLNGVVLTAAAIEYNGVKYEEVDKTPKVGDILRVDESGDDWVTEGAYYEVDHVDNSDDPQIIDNDGDIFDGADIEYTLFRKVSEPQTQPYREVNRAAKVSERIKIVEPYLSAGRYKKGDELIVHSVDADGSGDVRIMINGERTLIARKEYIVLEPIAEQSDDIIDVDDVKYRKVDRAPKVGDFVYALKDAWDLTEGSVYEIRRIDSDGDGVFRDDVGDSQYIQKHTNTLLLVERIASTEDLERQVTELQAKLSEVESELAAKKAEEEKARNPRNAFAKGDKVRLISGGDEHPLRGYKDGEVYTVSDPLYSYSNKIEITGGQIRTGYALPEQLTKLSEKEIAEMDRLKVGEYAKVIGGNNCHTEIGDIVIIRSVDSEGDYEINSLDGRELGGFKFAKNLVRATDEEVAEAKRKLELSEEIAKWAAIGRKVGEFKKGDVVEIIANTNGSVNSVGSIGTVTVGPSLSGTYRVDTGSGTQSNWTIPSEMKLIAPVESVVNLSA